jgi:hypothetical protein
MGHPPTACQMPPDVAIVVDGSAIHVDESSIWEARKDATTEARCVTHIRAPGNKHTILRSGDGPACLRASRVHVVPARGVVVEEDPAAGSTPCTGGAACLTVKGSGIGAYHRPRRIPDSETGVIARTIGGVLHAQVRLGRWPANRDHRGLLLGGRRTSHAESWQRVDRARRRRGRSRGSGRGIR